MNHDLLIQEIAKGNELAFRNLVSEFSAKVYNICYGYVQNRMEAEDLAQEVFIEIHRSAAKFKRSAKPGTWIYRIAVNKCLDHIRYKTRQKRAAEETSLDRATHLQVSDTGQNPEQMMTKAERYQSLWNAIGLLPETQRTALVLCNFDGMSYKEAAEVMKISLSSLESLIFRAKKKLRDILTDQYAEIFAM